jgi:hypothetical protein
MKALTEYLNLDKKIIAESNFSVDKLKNIRISSYAHQIGLASIFVPTLICSSLGFSNGLYGAGIGYGAATIPLWLIYIRYGFRANHAKKKIKELGGRK